MPIATDGQGNYLTLDSGGQWVPAPRSKNPETGTEMIHDGDGWKPLPGSEPSALGSTLRGVVQGATFGFGDELRAGTDALVQGAGNLIRGTDGRPTMGQTYDASLAKSREQQRLDQLQHPYATTAGQIVGGVGGAVLGGEGLAAAGLVRGATTAAPTIGRVLGQGAVTGGVTGGVTGFGEGEGGVGERLKDAAIGAGTGAVVGAGTGAATAGVSRVISPVTAKSGEYANLVQKAKDEGIILSPGEETGSRPLKTAESSLAQMPFAAGPAEEAADAGARSLNRAVASKAGLDADRLTPDVLQRHTDTLGKQIGDLAANNNMQLDGNFVQQLGQVRQGLRYLNSDAAQEIGAKLDQLRDMIKLDPATGNPIVAGPQYRTLLSELRDSITGATGDARRGMAQFRDMLRTQMESSMAQDDAAKWRSLNRQYANLAVIKDAMGGAGASVAEGNISPLALRGAVGRSLGGDAYAMGYGDLNDIARVGQSVLRKPPDSGTAGRTYINKLMSLGAGGSGGVIGTMVGGPVGGALGAVAGLAGPRLTQMAMQSGPGRAYLTNQLATELDDRVLRALAASGGEFGARRNPLLNQ